MRSMRVHLDHTMTSFPQLSINLKRSSIMVVITPPVELPLAPVVLAITTGHITLPTQVLEVLAMISPREVLVETTVTPELALVLATTTWAPEASAVISPQEVLAETTITPEIAPVLATITRVPEILALWAQTKEIKEQSQA
jgi:hypothetical protein